MLEQGRISASSCVCLIFLQMKALWQADPQSKEFCQLSTKKIYESRECGMRRVAVALSAPELNGYIYKLF
jgi:hypothetical protein